jgi:hypothetical protein
MRELFHTKTAEDSVAASVLKVRATVGKVFLEAMMPPRKKGGENVRPVLIQVNQGPSK